MSSMSVDEVNEHARPLWSLRRKPAFAALVVGFLALLMLYWLNSMGTVCAISTNAPCPLPGERTAVVGQWALVIGPLALAAVALGGLRWMPLRYVSGALRATLVLAAAAAFISIVNTGGLTIG
jgi:hypothetical protein